MVKLLKVRQRHSKTVPLPLFMKEVTHLQHLYKYSKEISLTTKSNKNAFNLNVTNILCNNQFSDHTTTE